MNPLHIALISETFPPEINALAQTLGRLHAGLCERGHSVQLVRPRQQGDPPLAPLGQLLTRSWPLPGYPRLRWGLSSLHKLLRNWQRQRPDVLYIATEGPLGLCALRAARRLGIPVVSGFHTHFQPVRMHAGLDLLGHLLGQYLRWFHNRSQLTLASSLSQYHHLSRHGFEHLELLPRGVDGQLFNPAKRSTELRASWGLAEDDLAVLHFGKLMRGPHLERLRRGFDALQASHPRRRCRLIVVASGAHRTVQQDLPHALLVARARGEALAELYASGDILLMASHAQLPEGQGLEAMASGLAVVAFDQGTAAQHIRHGHNGVLALPGDENGFVQACCWLLQDEETLRRVRLNARQYGGRQGWSGIVENFEQQLYRIHLLQQRPD